MNPPTRTRRGSITSSSTFTEATQEVRQQITVGCPKEVKVYEFRVGLTPASAFEYIKNGHAVVIETNAGAGSGFLDADYQKIGCTIVKTAKEVFDACQMIIKVKEPIAQEYSLVRKNQILFTYFHFASSRELTEAMIKAQAVCVAYETVSQSNGALPLLIPMSEVAGRMAIQEGMKYLEKPMGGSGILLGGVPGVKPGKVLILGGGIVGTGAALVAAGAGAEVTIMDISLCRLRELAAVLPKNCRTLYSSCENINAELPDTDLLVGAVLIPGAKAPLLVTKEQLKLMKPGSVVVDVAVDQGGCIESCRPTTHEKPTYELNGVVHYCVANMPGAVPCTSTSALNNATLHYGLQLANKGWIRACAENEELKKGLNIVHVSMLFSSALLA
eukprot:GHVT01043205.1.p1 GENE.GHVT01043205.1~~GHVT01043205.1.p1  ORF type:complete len:387 (-),score=54.74 GHVT01043205.1:1024-2184(-)